MLIDKLDHQKLLLEMLVRSNYPGHMIELAVELKAAVQNAEIAEKQPVAPEPTPG
jgi:hypothetical protein